jgi:serine/threonine protein kinase
VYEGIDGLNGSHVALKVMTAKEGRASVPIAGVRKEINYARSVQHPNVVRLIDFISEAGTMVIVWELIDGPDLLDLLNERGGRIDEASAAGFFAQLLRGVTFMHASGLCHRDLKPENCMVERATNRLKIIDFGLSKHQQSAVTLGVGTPDYMSPELLGLGPDGAALGAKVLYERREGCYDASACDVWAMGVLLYLIVSGVYPFEDPLQPSNVVATLENITGGRMRPPPKRLSPHCVDIIRAMLQRNPSQRITLAQLARHPWLQQHGLATPEDEKEEEHEDHPMELEETMDIYGPSATISSEDASPRGLNAFSFGQQPTVSSKATPQVISAIVAPIATGRGGGAAFLGSSPVVSPPSTPPMAPRTTVDGGKDVIVPVVRPKLVEEGEQVKKPRLGALCRLWFGSGRG